MFTGIIECTGKVVLIEKTGTNLSFTLTSPISEQLKVDQSLSHNGVCLTIEKINGNQHQVTAIQETLSKTNLSSWEIGAIINLERCMLMNGRIDGHMVQGHVDCVATCLSVSEQNGSWEYRFQIPANFSHLVIEKGSIAVNGTSLTCFQVSDTQFTVAIIPYTFTHTNIHQIKAGSIVNIEFDILGKYVAKQLTDRK